MPAWLALVRTYSRFYEQVETQMRRDHGLTMARYDVLVQLDMAGSRLGLSELAASILLSQSGLSKLLDRMAVAGLVRRAPDPSDARAAFADITPQGRALIRKARGTHHEFLRQTFAASLDGTDLADLIRIMHRLGGSVPPAGSTPPPRAAQPGS